MCNCKHQKILLKGMGYYPGKSYGGDYDSYNCEYIYIKLVKGHIVFSLEKTKELSGHKEYNFKINYCPLCGQKIENN